MSDDLVPDDSTELLLVTGMSGAGRSTTANVLEDRGWYVVDNLPPKLLVPLVDDRCSRFLKHSVS